MASSSNFVFLVTFMMVALVVQDSAAQQCKSFGTSCDTGNPSSCCSGTCDNGFLRDGNNGTCGCSTLDGPCATNADCCITLVNSWPRVGLEPLLTCSNSRCTVLQQPCLSSGARCDTGNQGSCCSGLCQSDGICGCTPRGPCATNDDCCDPSLPSVGPQAQVSICSDYRCTVGPRPTCSRIGASCDTGNPSSCCSGTCDRPLWSKTAICLCHYRGSCATNDDCCPLMRIEDPRQVLIPISQVYGCMNSRCVE